MQETKSLYTKEDMQPVVDFMTKYLDLIPQEGMREALKKIVDNFDVALKAAADNEEKHAFLFALYVNNASAMATRLFEYRALTKDAQDAFYALPSRADAEAALKPYTEATEAAKNEIMAKDRAMQERARGLQVLSGIANGDTPEEAKEKVAQYEQQQAQAMGGQRQELAIGKYWRTTSSGKRVRTAAGVRHELIKFQSSTKAKKDRAARNSARRSAIRKGIAHKGDGKDIHHSNHNPRDNRSSNLKAISSSRNRGIHEKSRKRGSKRKRTTWGK